uniref:Uncharacterized protein n=1 Tax=Arundo donax TaxID=35708 RepID=A0A0A9FY42_ARUDO
MVPELLYLLSVPFFAADTEWCCRVARIFFPNRRNPHNPKDSCNGNDG